MLSLKDFEKVKILKSDKIAGGSIKTGGGSRDKVYADGKRYCFSYTSDCTITIGDVTETRFCGVTDCE